VIRWGVAAVSALALALLTLPVDLDFSHAAASTFAT
jgi:hypothetical protein